MVNCEAPTHFPPVTRKDFGRQLDNEIDILIL